MGKKQSPTTLIYSNGEKKTNRKQKKYFLILNYMCLNISLPLFFYEQPCFLNLLWKLVIPMLTEIRLMTCNSTHHQVQQVSHGSFCPLACRGSILSHASPGNFLTHSLSFQECTFKKTSVGTLLTLQQRVVTKIH